MNHRRTVIWASILAAAGALAIQWSIAHQLHAGQEKLAALEALLKARTLEMKQVSDRLSAANRSLAQLRQDAANSKGLATQKAAAEKKAVDQSPQRNLAVVAKDPKLRSSYLRALSDERQVQFAGLFAKLGFTAEQREKFAQAEGAYQEGMLDMAAAAADQGIAWSDPSIDRIKSELSGTLDDQLKTLFGANYDQWTDTNMTANSRAIVGQVLQRTYDGPGAISGAEADQLTSILANNNARYRPGQRPVDPTSYNWDAVLAQASGILTPAQLAAFTSGTELVRLRSQADSAAKTTVGLK